MVVFLGGSVGAVGAVDYVGPVSEVQRNLARESMRSTEGGNVLWDVFLMKKSMREIHRSSRRR